MRRTNTIETQTLESTQVLGQINDAEVSDSQGLTDLILRRNLTLEDGKTELTRYLREHNIKKPGVRSIEELFNLNPPRLKGEPKAKVIELDGKKVLAYQVPETYSLGGASKLDRVCLMYVAGMILPGNSAYISRFERTRTSNPLDPTIFTISTYDISPESSYREVEDKRRDGNDPILHVTSFSTIGNTDPHALGNKATKEYLRINRMLAKIAKDPREALPLFQGRNVVETEDRRGFYLEEKNQAVFPWNYSANETPKSTYLSLMTHAGSNGYAKSVEHGIIALLSEHQRRTKQAKE